MTTQERLAAGVHLVFKELERRTLILSGPLEGRPSKVQDFHGRI